MNREVLREADNAIQRMLLQPPLPSKASKLYPKPVQKASYSMGQFGIPSVVAEPLHVIPNAELPADAAGDTPARGHC